MKNRWALLLAASAGIGLAAPCRAETWAVLVGVSKYRNPQVSALRFPSADAQAIRDALIDPQLGALPADHVKLLADDQATGAAIAGAVDDFLKPNVKQGDQVILFLAGHGVAKGVGVEAKSYFLPADVKGHTIPALEQSAVDMKALSQKLGALPASQFVLFVDACREDPTPGRGLKGNPRSDILTRSLHVLPRAGERRVESATFFACKTGQRAYEDPKLEHGVFTYWILNGIRQAAVPQKPDGAVDLGRLAYYVTGEVENWAKKASASGEFEIEQTPEIVTSELEGPIILMRVKRPLADTPLPAGKPRVTIETVPEASQVLLGGVKLGAGPLIETQVPAGEFRVRVEAPGYTPVERSIKVLDGYQYQIVVPLEPAGGASGQPAGQAAQLYNRALALEGERQWEAAVSGYEAVLGIDPKFAPAYERLIEVRMRLGQIEEGIATGTTMMSQVPPTARGYALMSRCYLRLARQKQGEAEPEGDKAEPKRKSGGLLGKLTGGGKGGEKKDDGGKEAREAARQAEKAARAAVKLDPASAEAQLALGLALVATDEKGKNKPEAMKAFGQAVFLDDKDPANQYGLGYGYRVFAMGQKEGAARQAELKRAVEVLKIALSRRPDYYEAHRELAFCYHLLDDTEAALREYEVANACRGGASDEDEVAGLNVALSGLHQQEAQKARGPRSEQHKQASTGYLDDAKEIRPNLVRALSILATAGVSSRLSGLLTPDLNGVLGRLKSRIPGGGSLPGFPGLPF